MIWYSECMPMNMIELGHKFSELKEYPIDQDGHDGYDWSLISQVRLFLDVQPGSELCVAVCKSQPCCVRSTCLPASPISAIACAIVSASRRSVHLSVHKSVKYLVVCMSFDMDSVACVEGVCQTAGPSAWQSVKALVEAREVWCLGLCCCGYGCMCEGVL